MYRNPMARKTPKNHPWRKDSDCMWAMKKRNDERKQEKINQKKND